jgi:hypothetical protein
VPDADVIVLASAPTPEARNLRMHCLCGDDLAWRGDIWFAASGVVTEASGDGVRLTFRYRSADGQERTIEFGRYDPHTVQETLEIARDLPPDAADRRWRALAERAGPVPPMAGCTTKTVALSGGEILAARRLVHPSYIIDKLMMRDRAMAVAEVETLLFHARPSLETLRCA